MFNLDQKRNHRILYHIIFWLGVWIFKGIFQYSLNIESYRGLPLGRQIYINFSFEFFLTVIKIGLSYLIAQLYFKNKGQIGVITVAKIIFVFILGILLRLTALSFFVNAFSQLFTAFDLSIFNDLSRWMNSVIDNGFILGIFLLIKNYRRQLLWLRNEQILLKEKLTYEMDFLRAQISPHFLFNTLNNLFSIAQQKENHELADGISKLSGIMRYMLYESSANFVPLEKEIEYINYFIGLNKLRFQDDELAIEFNYPSQTSAVMIAPMILIPFVENAFKHGIVIGKHSSITLSIEIIGKHLIFTCINNVYQKINKMNTLTKGIGLENVRRRLKLIYPGAHELLITENEIRFCSTLKIIIA